MRKIIIPAILILILAFGSAFPGLGAAAQDTRPGVVRVPVRVFEGNRFVDGLKMADFEVLENGLARPIRNFYAVDRDTVLRPEGDTGFLPFVGRRFTLMFQLFEYQPKLAEAIRFVVEKELRPADTLEIQTPMKNYQLPEQVLAAEPRRAIADRLIEIVKTDIAAGGMAYNSLLTEMKKLVRTIGGADSMSTLETDNDTNDFTPEMLMPRYRTIIQNMDNLRRIDTEKFVQFAQALKKKRGRKVILYFYQREFRPEIDPQVLNQMFSLNQDNNTILGDLQELFQTTRVNFNMDIPRMKNAFADSGAEFSLLFLNKTPERVARIIMREQSEDIFRALGDIAEATGGMVDTSQNPATGVQSILNSDKRYYLLDYDAGPSQPAGAFNTISLRIKGKDYKILHRAGYLN
jgi:hypothetical protein